jgi:hypothetical protein
MAVTFRPEAATGTQHRLNPRCGNDKRRSGELRTQPNVGAPTPPQQFASRLLLEVLVQWWRRLALTTNA